MVLCGSHRPGAMGLNTARQFAAQGVSTIVYLRDVGHMTTQVSQELSLYKLTGQKFTNNIQGLYDNFSNLINFILS